MTNYETAYPELGGRSVVFEGAEYSIPELYGRFATHPHGEYQAIQEPRFYKVYGYGSYEEFMADLGDDTHPIRHMLHTTANIAVPLLSAQAEAEAAITLDLQGEAIILVTSITHDTDECEHPDIFKALGYVVGDVPKLMVTADDEDKKRKIRRNFVYPIHYPDFSTNLVNAVEDTLSGDPYNFESFIFQKIEHAGYFLTAMRAAELVEANHNSADTDPRILALAHLAVKVSSNWTASLGQARAILPYIDQILLQSSARLAFIDSELEEENYYTELRS